MKQAKRARNELREKTAPKYELSDSESSSEHVFAKASRQIDSKWLEEKARQIFANAGDEDSSSSIWMICLR